MPLLKVRVNIGGFCCKADDLQHFCSSEFESLDSQSSSKKANVTPVTFLCSLLSGSGTQTLTETRLGVIPSLSGPARSRVQPNPAAGAAQPLSLNWAWKTSSWSAKTAEEGCRCREQKSIHQTSA